jgi:hypothetical protein
MKRFGLRTILAVSAFCFLAWFTPLKAYGDPVTLTMENVGPGNNSGGVYTYPYNFSVNGSTTYTPLMCYMYLNEISIGETWTASVVSLSSSSSIADQELAYLFSVANNPSSSTATASDAQWAAWELFDPGLTAPDQAGVNAELAAAASFVSNAANKNFDAGYQLYIPLPGTQPTGDGVPQSFIGVAPTPEPSSLILLGSGLLCFAGVLYFKRRTQTVAAATSL